MIQSLSIEQNLRQSDGQIIFKHLPLIFLLLSPWRNSVLFKWEEQVFCLSLRFICKLECLFKFTGRKVEESAGFQVYKTNRKACMGEIVQEGTTGRSKGIRVSVVCDGIIRPIRVARGPGDLEVKRNHIMSSTPAFPPRGGHFCTNTYQFAQCTVVDNSLVMKYLASTGDLEMKKTQLLLMAMHFMLEFLHYR